MCTTDAPKFWANNTYPSGVTAVGAKANLDYFHDRLHMHFGGIRKPRTYSNQNLSAANGWLLPNNFSVGAGGNNWNTSTGQSPDWTAWYTKSACTALAIPSQSQPDARH